MTHRARTLLPLASAVVLAAMIAAAPALADADIFILNFDAGTGRGFDDPTPVAPEGGNPGTTLGQQRLIALQVAADVWGAALDSPVPVVVVATFRPLPCAANGAVSGSAGALEVTTFEAGTPGVVPDTWYHIALAEAIAGSDLNAPSPDILAQFNSLIQGDPDCLGGKRFYYGLDNQEGSDVDFLSVALHELAHGLGFGNFVDETSGANFLGTPDIYSVFTFDSGLGLTWDRMSDGQRAFSATHAGFVTWSGAAVSERVPRFLDRRAILRAVDPPLGLISVQPAAFGPPLTLEGVEGAVVLADDGVGATTDACEPLIGPVRGAIALIDRGSCTFTTKVRHAEEAGAIAAIVANNQPGGPASMGGSDPSIGIPSAGITLFEGGFLRSVLPGLVVRLGLSENLFLGTDTAGRMLLFAPSPAVPGSSITHWERVATPNLLMEPAISSTVESAATLDLTPFLLQDVGWPLSDDDGDGLADVEDACPTSDTAPTVTLGDCDSGVANVHFPGGCTLADEILACGADARNHGEFVRCVTARTNELRDGGALSGAEKGAIVACAAQSGR